MDGLTVAGLVVGSGITGVLIGLASLWQEVRLALRELPLRPWTTAHA